MVFPLDLADRLDSLSIQGRLKGLLRGQGILSPHTYRIGLDNAEERSIYFLLQFHF